MEGLQPRILDGRIPARELEALLLPRVEHLERRGRSRPPTLAVVLVGDDPLALRHAQLKVDAAARLRIRAVLFQQDPSSSTADVLSTIDRLNADADFDGVFLQHPVPPQVDERRCFDRIAVAKDVGGDSTLSLGHLALAEPGFVSTTPAGVMRLLTYYAIEVAGREALVVGRSPMVGKPMALLLVNAHATVTIAHSRSRDLPRLVGRAELLVAAVGKPHAIERDWIRPGAVIVDAGYHTGGRGDVNPRAAERASAITPVPGGVGPMTRAMLLTNTVLAAEGLS